MSQKPGKLSAAFAAVLKEKRTARKMSMETLAETAGLHQTYIGLIERGLRNPSLDTLQVIADALEVRASSLIREAEGIGRKC